MLRGTNRHAGRDKATQGFASTVGHARYPGVLPAAAGCFDLLLPPHAARTRRERAAARAREVALVLPHGPLGDGGLRVAVGADADRGARHLVVRCFDVAADVECSGEGHPRRRGCRRCCLLPDARSLRRPNGHGPRCARCRWDSLEPRAARATGRRPGHCASSRFRSQTACCRWPSPGRFCSSPCSP